MARETTRVMLTGERDWRWPELVTEAIENIRFKWGAGVVFIFGDCPSGVDKIAYEYCSKNAIPYERLEARWDKFGNAAGPIRNGELVDLGPKLCCAFWSGKRLRSGTLDAFSQAAAAHVPVRITPPPASQPRDGRGGDDG